MIYSRDVRRRHFGARGARSAPRSARRRPCSARRRLRLRRFQSLSTGRNRCSSIRFGFVVFEQSSFRFGSVRFGSARPRSVRFGSVGSVRSLIPSCHQVDTPIAWDESNNLSCPTAPAPLPSWRQRECRAREAANQATPDSHSKRSRSENPRIEKSWNSPLHGANSPLKSKKQLESNPWISRFLPRNLCAERMHRSDGVGRQRSQQATRQSVSRDLRSRAKSTSVTD